MRTQCANNDPFKRLNDIKLHRSNILKSSLVASSLLLVVGISRPAEASIAYGSINNFDCVNDTGSEAHGFDIELDDLQSKDITYTYDYNHYGKPTITEDDSVAGHPKVLVRYAGSYSGGKWSAYTAIPSGPIAPTMGHQFTNPSINFGGEHFGLGYMRPPSSVKYNWLIDDGTGNLIHGAPVNVSTPTFVYNPPVAAAPPVVVAVVVPPPPPVLPPKQFGEATWVKEIKTTTHNANKVELAKLVGDDPGKPQPWANGEPAEVEVEWKILQTDFTAAKGGKNGELDGAPEGLPNGNEVITRRYEFYKYTGPLDAETGEAMADAVGADKIHGVGSVTYADHFDLTTYEWVTVTTDLTTVAVVGDYIGAQMAGFDVAPNLGLIDNIQDGKVGDKFPDRTVVVPGQSPFSARVKTGSLPDGLTFDGVTGILSGTPTKAGSFTFTIEAQDLGGALISKSYTINITDGGAVVPAVYTVATSASPAGAGTTTGDGSYNSGANVTVTATANAGYSFVSWTENGTVVSNSASYTFSIGAARTLVANFSQDVTPPTTSTSLAGTAGTNGWYLGDVQVTLSATDDLSGVANTYFTLDGGLQQTYAAPFTVSGAGSHAVQYWSVDNATNTEAQKTANVKIDNDLPTVNILKPFVGAEKVVVTVNASDATSGVANIFFTDNGGAAQTYTGPYTTYISGAHTFDAWSVDNAGNTSAHQTINFTIKYITPIVNAVAPNVFATGDTGGTLVIKGDKFSPASQVLWNGTPLVTTFVSKFRLTAEVPAALIASPGTASITVTNPGVAASAAQTVSIVTLAITGVELPTSTVIGGTKIIDPIIRLNATVNSPVTVTIASDKAAAVPATTATIRAGSNGTVFSIRTRTVTAITTAKITATLGTSSQSNTLTITP